MEEDEKKNVPVQKAEWLPLVKDSIKKRFLMTDEQLDALCKALVEHRALIAGGFVLQAVIPEGQRNQINDKVFNRGDLDIYVPIKEIQPFIEKIFTPTVFRAPERHREVLASLYCRSFLRRNGIRSVKTYTVNYPGGMSDIHIDLMSVRNHRSPIEVVTNFDLTFCQIWFDGEAVYASHPQHIETRNGLLQRDYVETYLSGNRFLKNRIEKYIRRGFNIQFDHAPDPSTLIERALTTSPPHNRHSYIRRKVTCFPDSSEEEALTHSVRRALLQKFHLRKRHGEDVHYVFAIPCYHRDNKVFSGNDSLKWSSSGVRHIERQQPFPHLRNTLLPYEGYDSDDEESMIAYQKDPSTEWSDTDYQKDVTYLYVNSLSVYDNVMNTAIYLLHTGDVADMEDKMGELEDALYKLQSVVPTHTTLYDLYSSMARKIKDRKLMYNSSSYLTTLQGMYQKYNMWRKVIESMLPQGEDMFGRKGPLLLLHQHDTSQGITPESLKEYIEKTKNGSEDKLKTCFVPGCDKKITLVEQECVMTANPFKHLLPENKSEQAGGKRKHRLNRLKRTFRQAAKGHFSTRFSVSLKQSKSL